MAIARTCSECAKSLAGYATQAKTCSASCRQARARRTRKMSKAAARESTAHLSAPPEIREIVLLAQAATPDVVKKEVQRQLAPIVRDALTESALQSIQDLLKLTPRAVAALAEDLDDEDPVIRQRAYALQLKYTIGHPALVQPEQCAGGGQMSVVFNLPRPDTIPDDVEAEVTEVRECDLCNTEKPADEFVGASSRCQECMDRWKSDVETQFAKP